MEQNISTRPTDWLGLHRLAEMLGPAVVHGSVTHSSGEVVDRLERTLEILGLVEDNKRWLREEARRASPHETMQLASDLRRLANRLEAIGAFLLELGNGVVELEEQVLVEFDDRIRRQSETPGARDPVDRWATVHAA